MAKPTSKPVGKPASKPVGKPAPKPSGEPMGPARRMRLRLGLRYAFLLATAVIILHYNVVRPYLLGGQEMNVAARDAPRWLHPPAAAYHALVEVGSRSGLAIMWRMYSPVPKRVYYTEITAQDASGRWVPLPSPGLPREYREQRSLLSALLWDFKRARINDNYFIYRYEPWLHVHYLAVSRDRIVRKLGQVPKAVRVRVKTAPIPPPSEKGDWQPERAVFDDVMWEDEYQ
jgi:hypothetical protein